MTTAIRRAPAPKNRPVRARRLPAPRRAFPQSAPDPHPWIAQIDRLQNGLKLTQIELATHLLHCTPRSLILWKKGRTPNPATLIRLAELTRLYAALADLMPPADVPSWIQRTNDYLDPLTPLEVINRGQIDRLWHIIHNVATGMPS